MPDILTLQDRHTAYRYFHGHNSEKKLEMFVEILEDAEEKYMIFDELNPRQKLQLLLNIQTIYSCFKTEAGLLKAQGKRMLERMYAEELERFSLLTTMAYQTPLADLKFEAERYVTPEEFRNAALAKNILEALYVEMRFIIEDQDDEAVAVRILQQKIQEVLFEKVFRKLAAIQLKRNNRDKVIKKTLKNRFPGNFDVVNDVDMLDHDLKVHYYNSFSLDYEDNNSEDYSYSGTFKFQCGEIVIQLEDIMQARKVATIRGKKKRNVNTTNPVVDRIESIKEAHIRSYYQAENLKTSNAITSIDLLDNFSKVRGGL